MGISQSGQEFDFAFHFPQHFQQALEPEGFGILLGSGILLGIKQLKVDCNRITSSEFVNLMQSVLVIRHKRR